VTSNFHHNWGSFVFTEKFEKRIACRLASILKRGRRLAAAAAFSENIENPGAHITNTQGAVDVGGPRDTRPFSSTLTTVDLEDPNIGY